jgi:hypothetical protein
MGMDRDELLKSIDRMVIENRQQCLWFLRADFFPVGDRMRFKVLEYIQRHGNREAALQAARLSRWLSQTSRDTSAGS